MNRFKLFLAFYFVISISLKCFSQNYEWAKGIGSAATDIGNSIAVDDSGNVYITGTFFNTVDFDPGTGVANLTSAGYTDIFLAKYDKNGNYLWAYRIGNTGADNSKQIILDDSGNIYITGYFSGTADFNFGTDTVALTPVGSSDIFFAKYDNNGNYIMAKSFGGINDDNSYSITIDALKNIYITGYFSTTADFDPGVSVANLTSVGSYDIFFAKYDSNGNYVWAKSVGSTNNDFSYYVALDNIGNVYITGQFYNSADFDPGPGTATVTTYGGGIDLFFAKYDNNGNYIWAKHIGASWDDLGTAIAIDNSNNVYITGKVRGTVDFDPGAATANITTVGTFDIFFAKYDSNGSYIWAKNVGSTSYDESMNITLDSLNNIYITGSFAGVADFDPGTGVANLTATNTDIFFAKYDLNGNYIFAKNIGNSSVNEGQGITVDASGSVYITGYFQGIADFDPSAGIANVTGFGMYDIYFAKYNLITNNKQIANETNELLIYPNPATDEVSIELLQEKNIYNNANLNNNISYIIFSVDGKKVKEGKLINSKSSISTKEMESGLYFIEIIIKNKKVNKKILILK